MADFCDTTQAVTHNITFYRSFWLQLKVGQGERHCVWFPTSSVKLTFELSGSQPIFRRS